MKIAKQREAYLFVLADGSAPFEEWTRGLKDIAVAARVAARIRKMEEGSFGDTRGVGGGVVEARIHLGAGWRLYYGLDEDVFVILLCGGSKRTQKRDIKKAKEFWREYEQTKTKRAR